MSRKKAIGQPESRQAGVCALCGAGIWRRRNDYSWCQFPEEVCPLYRPRRKRIPFGCLELTGAFLDTNHKSIERFLRDAARSEANGNPENRILGWHKYDGGRVIITTTTGELARLLADVLEQAFGGQLRSLILPQEGITRVIWQRD